MVVGWNQLQNMGKFSGSARLWLPYMDMHSRRWLLDWVKLRLPHCVNSKRLTSLPGLYITFQKVLSKIRFHDNNAGYTMFRGSVKSTGYPFHSPVSPLLPLPCVTVCHYVSNGLYLTEHGAADRVADCSLNVLHSWLRISGSDPS